MRGRVLEFVAIAALSAGIAVYAFSVVQDMLTHPFARVKTALGGRAAGRNQLFSVQTAAMAAP